MSAKTRKRNRLRKMRAFKKKKKEDSLRNLRKEFFLFPEESDPGLHIDSRYKSEELKRVLYDLTFFFYALRENPLYRKENFSDEPINKTGHIKDIVLLDLSSTRIILELLSKDLYKQIEKINREVRYNSSETERAFIYKNLFLFILKNYDVSNLLPEERIKELKQLSGL